MPNDTTSLETVLEKLSDSDRDNLRRVAGDLGIEPTDALWSVLAALEYYRKLYAEMPEAIDETVRASLGGIKAAADAEVEASRARLEGSLTEAVAAVANEVVKKSAQSSLTQWIVGGALGGVIVCGTAFWAGLQTGKAEGYSRGRDSGLEATAAASWAATPMGVDAFRFWKTGEISHLAQCDRPGWIVVDGVCYPQQSKGRVYGWSIK